MSDDKTLNGNHSFGHAFVGNYLCLCARVEDWTIATISQAQSSLSKPKSKMPHLFGLKLRAVRDLADVHPEIFSKPARIIELMDQFAEAAKMRSNLAHSVVCNASNGEATYWLFHNVGTNERFWLAQDQMKSEISELKKLMKQITDQQMKKATPPSSLPQPKQAAKAGP